MPQVFVYGTLKRGFHNHNYLLKDTGEFLGEHITTPNYTMVSLGGFPGVLLDGQTSIKGEVFSVDDGTFKRLDGLEGYPNFYNRLQIETPFGPAWMYFLEDREEYLNDNVVETGRW